MDINQSYREAVKTIKEAILRSQYRAAVSVNKEQLSLYYGIGRYVSENSRTGFWGKGAIEQISSLLQKELPGLRGFSATSIRNMRIFYEEWDKVLNHPPLADDLVLNEKLLLVEIHQPLADEFNWSDFLSIGFSHHTEIISKAKTLEARLFYYNPQIQISAESETKRSIFRKRDKTKRSKKESAQHSKSRNKSFVMTSVSAL